MKILDRIKSLWQSRSGSVWSGVQSWGALSSGNMSRTGLNITPETALGLTACYAAINTIATDVASLPLRVYRKQPNGGREEMADHPLAILLAESPDGETTSMRWRQAMMGHALGWGNGYAELTYDGDGFPRGMYLLDPRTEPQRRAQDKRLYYRKADGGTLPPYRVLHVAGWGYDGLKGYSPIMQAREAVGLGLAAESFGSTFFGNGSSPKGILKTPNAVTPEMADRLRAGWEDLHRGLANSHKVAVLEQGLEWQSISIPPEDAQFILTRQFQVVEIARLFRLPPHKIGDYSQSHLANIEAANLDYMTTVLMPWCEAIEQEINRKLLTTDERRAGYYVEHQMQAFLRGDMKARAEFYLRMRDLGAINPNEIRARENMDPIGPAGDVYLVPLNMTNLEHAGEKPEPPEPPDVPDAPADIEDDSPDEVTTNDRFARNGFH
jgi:HK97 family phage portal protein